MRKEMNRIRRVMARQNPKQIIRLTHKIIEQIGGSESNKQDLLRLTKARGVILDMSIRLETIFNELLLLFNKPKMIDSSFKTKVEFLRKVILEVDSEAKQVSDETQNKRLIDLVLIRNLFAHVPVNPHAQGLEFETRDPYDVYFNHRFELKDIANAAREFSSLYGYIEEEIGLLLHLLEEHLIKKGHP